MLLALWHAHFDQGDAPPPVVVVPDGGIGEREYKRYRKHLEKMLAAAESRNFEAYNNSVRVVKKLADKANVELPSPKAVIAETRKIEYVLPDYEKTRLALNELLIYIERRKIDAIIRQNELDDDVFMMLMLA